MFYSELLRSNKGALGVIWMAAHCHKRLRKDQVHQTNISSSVDKILDDEVHIVTHRILAFLLLGIVRIYSKKVEYLFHDSHEVLNRLCSFKTGKRATLAIIEVPQRHYHSITLPERFELDAFDLGLDQDASSGKERSQERDKYCDGRKKDCRRSGSFCKCCVSDGRKKDCRRSGSFCKVIAPISEALSTAHTPPRDVFGAHRVDGSFVKPSSSDDISLDGVEVLRRALCSLKDFLDPLQLDESAEGSENEQLNDSPSNYKTSPNFRRQIQEEQMHDISSHKDRRTNSQGLISNAVSDFVVGPSSSLFPSLEMIQEEQMHDISSHKDRRINSQGLISSTVSDFVVGPSCSRFLSFPSLEMLHGGLTLEDRLEPMELDEAEKVQLYERLSDKSTSSNGHGPIQDVELNSVENQSSNRINPVGNVGILHESYFSLSGFTLEDRLEPMMLDEGEKVPLYERPSDKSTSSNGHNPIQDVELNSVENQSPNRIDCVENMGILCESDFSLNGSENKEGHDQASNDLGDEDEHIDHLNTPLSFQEGEDQDLNEGINNVAPVALELKPLEVIAPECMKSQKSGEVNMPVLNPEKKLPAADVGIEVAAVQTPGRKERARILKKRKTLLDEATVVPNKVLKSWIGDPMDLTRGKKETSHTLFQVWRVRKLCHLPQSILEPLVPGISVDPTYLGCRESYVPEIKSAASLSASQASVTDVAQEQVPDIVSCISKKLPHQIPDVRSPVAENSNVQSVDIIAQEQIPDIVSCISKKLPHQIPDARSLVAENSNVQSADIISLEQAPALRSPLAENSADQIPIAPGTPAAYLNSSRFHGTETVADSNNLEPSFSLESLDNLDALFQEVTSSYKGDSSEKSNDMYSARTRMTGCYLSRKFLQKKMRQEEQVLNLSHLLAGKTRKESTIMFYEILVLKTRDCIDVQQETAYRDVILRETPKLGQYFK